MNANRDKNGNNDNEDNEDEFIDEEFFENNDEANLLALAIENSVNKPLLKVEYESENSNDFIHKKVKYEDNITLFEIFRKRLGFLVVTDVSNLCQFLFNLTRYLCSSHLRLVFKSTMVSISNII